MVSISSRNLVDAVLRVECLLARGAPTKPLKSSALVCRHRQCLLVWFIARPSVSCSSYNSAIAGPEDLISLALSEPSAHAVDLEYRIQAALADSGVSVPRMPTHADPGANISATRRAGVGRS